MEFIAKTFPGVAAFVAVSLTVFAIVQFVIYAKTRYQIYLVVGLFCLLASPKAYEQIFVQARIIDPDSSFYLMCIAVVSLMLSFVFYSKAMNYIIPIPKTFLKVYQGGHILLAAAACIPWCCYFLIHEPLVVDFKPVVSADNYFLHSYTSILGTPEPFMHVHQLVIFGLNLALSIILLVKAKHRKTDFFLLTGVWFTILAIAYETVTITVNLKYFVPVLYMANYIEASRLTFLNVKKYLIARHKEKIEELFS